MSLKSLSAPLSDEAVRDLRAGDEVEISGEIFVARDAVHRQFNAALDKGEPLPLNLQGQVLYYIGPTRGTRRWTDWLSPGRPRQAASTFTLRVCWRLG